MANAIAVNIADERPLLSHSIDQSAFDCRLMRLGNARGGDQTDVASLRNEAAFHKIVITGFL
jgi:hypothetical protein